MREEHGWLSMRGRRKIEKFHATDKCLSRNDRETNKRGTDETIRIGRRSY